jgi:hypothetical protein
LAWTEKSRPLVTSDFLYLRINDNEENVIKKWIQKVNEKQGENQKGKELEYVIIFVDRPAIVSEV